LASWVAVSLSRRTLLRGVS